MLRIVSFVGTALGKLFYGTDVSERIEDAINCFQDLLTFREVSRQRGVNFCKLTATRLKPPL